MNELYPKIEAYLQDQMKLEERKAFEQACSDDPVLAEELAFYLQAQKASSLHAQVKKKQDFINRYRNRPQTVFSPLNWGLATAALILLLLASYWVVSQSNSPSLSQAIAQHLEPAQLPQASGSRTEQGDEVNADWEKAADFYSDKKYAECIDLLKGLENRLTPAQLSEMYLLLGSSYLQTGKFQESIKAYEQVSAVSIYAQEATWFKSLAYLKAKQTVEAQKSLLNISQDTEHYRRKEATQLLKLLDN